jgi:hypothetical protein
LPARAWVRAHAVAAGLTDVGVVEESETGGFADSRNAEGSNWSALVRVTHLAATGSVSFTRAQLDQRSVVNAHPAALSDTIVECSQPLVFLRWLALKRAFF